MTRWAMKAQHAPMPAPTRAIAGKTMGAGSIGISNATPAKPAAIIAGPATSRPSVRSSGVPATTTATTVQPNDAPATM